MSLNWQKTIKDYEIYFREVFKDFVDPEMAIDSEIEFFNNLRFISDEDKKRLKALKNIKKSYSTGRKELIEEAG